jgi:hypothetical protein
MVPRNAYPDAVRDAPQTPIKRRPDVPVVSCTSRPLRVGQYAVPDSSSLWIARLMAFAGIHL